MLNSDILDRLKAFEYGELNSHEIVALFQDLVNSGLAWELQGDYGRVAMELIDQGMVTIPKEMLQ